MEFNKISNYDINLRHTINGGIIVKVGCAELSFTSPEDMMDVMKQYYEDPKGMEKLYNHSGANEDVPQAVETGGSYHEARPEPRAGMGTAGGNTLSRGPRVEATEPNSRR